MSDVIITGIPRAGTTLAGALADNLPNTVCLNEPAWQGASAAHDAASFAAYIAHDFAKMRKRILSGLPLPDRRAPDGKALTNYFAQDAQGHMHNTYNIMPLVRENLPPDFTLAVKHNAPYLAALPDLIALKRFKIIAIIRRPLPVIQSWRRLQLPISYGDLPNAKIYWPELKQLIDTPMELLEKQVRIYEMMLGRILKYQSYLTLIDYDDLVQNPSLIAHALGKKNAHPPALVQPQKVQQSEEDGQIIEMLERYALLACGRWPR